MRTPFSSFSYPSSANVPCLNPLFFPQRNPGNRIRLSIGKNIEVVDVTIRITAVMDSRSTPDSVISANILCTNTRFPVLWAFNATYVMNLIPDLFV